jgi:hypothetical protein
MTSPNAPGTKRELHDLAKHETVLNSLPESVTLEPNEHFIQGGEACEQTSTLDAWFSARVPGSTPPSFKSFAIDRTYKLNLKLGIEIGGKKFEHRISSEVREMGSASA